MLEVVGYLRDLIRHEMHYSRIVRYNVAHAANIEIDAADPKLINGPIKYEIHARLDLAGS
jgi:hypothetical protein